MVSGAFFCHAWTSPGIDMTISSTSLIGLILFMSVGFLPYCSGENLCQSDYDCGSDADAGGLEKVCEPSGCTHDCVSDEDCIAPLRCQLREVEQGKACR